jgi:FkbM family methyltransferase
MIRRARRLLRNGLRSAGFDLLRVDPNRDPGVRLCRALEHFDVDLVLDVGANKGQFAKEIRSAGYQGEIVSFEPLSSAHAELLASASEDPLWQVADRVAVGARKQAVRLNIAGNSVSSSVLPMSELHRSAALNSGYIAAEDVGMDTLDQLARDYSGRAERPFVKIDAQGYEWEILDGATETLRRAHGVQCELSLADLYRGQRDWEELRARLDQEGFMLWALREGFTDPRNGRTLQCDGVFFRKDVVRSS